jgi:hypothetical protein
MACGLLLLLAACVEVTSRVEFNNQGGGTFSIEFLEIPSMPFDLVKQQLQAELRKSAAFQQALSSGQVRMTEGARDNRKFLLLDGSFKNAAELRDFSGNLLQASFQRAADGVLEVRFDRLPGKEAQAPMHLTVVMPGRVLAINTGSMSGNTAVWTVGNERTLLIRSEAGSGAAVAVAVVVVLAVAGVAMVFYIRARARRLAAQAAYGLAPPSYKPPSQGDSGAHASCPACGGKLKADATFCTQCGRRFEIEVEAVAPTLAPRGTNCPQCTAPVSPDDQFCGECGAALGR